MDGTRVRPIPTIWRRSRRQAQGRKSVSRDSGAEHQSPPPGAGEEESFTRFGSRTSVAAARRRGGRVFHAIREQNISRRRQAMRDNKARIPLLETKKREKDKNLAKTNLQSAKNVI